MKTIYFFIAAVILFGIIPGCQQEPKTTIDKIDVLYYNAVFEPILYINYKDMKKTPPAMDTTSVINYKRILDTVITDPKILAEIETELKKLQPIDDGDNPIDARIACTIRYKDGRVENLCIGGVYAEAIQYKTSYCKTNNKLLYLIKNAIGYYSWIGEPEISVMYELQDSTFQRDSIKGFSGKMY